MLDSECLVAACASSEFLIQSFSHECGIFGSTPSSHNIVRNLIKRVTQGRYLVEFDLCGGNFVVISITNFNFVFIWACIGVKSSVPPWISTTAAWTHVSYYSLAPNRVAEGNSGRE